MADAKIKIQQKLQVTDEQIRRWKFALLSTTTRYVQDDDVLLQDDVPIEVLGIDQGADGPQPRSSRALQDRPIRICS